MSIYNLNGFPISVEITPEQYGAVGNGTTDDTSAFQNAVNEKGLILCGTGKTYKITDTIRIAEDTTIDLNGSTILSTSNHLFFNFKSTDTSFTGYNGNGNICIRNGVIVGGAMSFAHGKNILLDNIHFMNSINDHFLEIAGCNNFRIIDCSFIGMEYLTTSVMEYINIDHCRYQNFPWMNSDSAFYDNTSNKGINVSNSKFALGESTYANGYNAFGVHSVTNLTNNHEDITVSDCEIYGFTGCGIRLNGMTNIYVNNNRIETSGDGIVIGDVGSCSGITIKNNYVVSSNGQKLVKTADRYTNLTVVGNSTYGTVEDF